MRMSPLVITGVCVVLAAGVGAMSGASQPVCLDPHAQAMALARALGGKGFTTIVLATGGHQEHPCVLVASGPERLARETECIYAAPEEGQWWFWGAPLFSWEPLERIAPVSEIDVTADKITCALTCSCGMCC
jgi:hypothetical protein